ncbi:MAG TPA: TonB-dependent receptor plug domain-containing protein, partial [Acidobacteriota bacterium]|nr:TonB-dependent receptor plug domain-containing protein [Acidobacteriota bacterium]
GAALEVAAATTVVDLVRRQPGVTQVDRELHIRGGRTHEIEYTVDGVAVTDPFLRQGMAVRLPTEVVDRLEIHTGGLDAGQGTASAGVVAVETRDPGARLTGSAAYRTDHLSPSDDGDWNSDEVELSLSGPFSALGLGSRDADQRLAPGFVLNLGARLSDTHLGRGDPNSSIWGGRRWVPRSDNDYHALAKFAWRFSPRHRIVLLFTGETKVDQDRSVLDTRLRTATYSYGWSYEYARHLSDYNTFTRQANMQMARWEWRPGDRNALSVTAARVFSRLHSDVNGKEPGEYVAPADIDPVTIEAGPDSAYFTVTAGDGFYDVGDGDLWYDHFVETYSAKAVWKSEPRPNWELETGLEGAAQQMQVVDIYHPWLGLGGLNTDYYRVSPSSGSWWGQSRFNFEGAVLDLGLRAEIWLPGQYLKDAVADTTLPNITPAMREGFTDQTFEFLGRRARAWVQPRLGVSYAMGPAASVFASYDRLVRKPNPRFLYAKLRSRSPATFQLFGNPALDLEKTTAIEGGVRWLYRQDLALTLTVYRREIADFIAAVVVMPDSTSPENFWYAYANQDYGLSRGLEIILEGRSGTTFRGSAMASFARVEANHSLPSDIFRGIEVQPTRKFVQQINLDWDKPWRTSFDISLSFGPDDTPRLFGIGLGRHWDLHVSFWAEAGKRYTPYADSLASAADTVYYRAGEPNSKLGPYWNSLDIAWQKHFTVGGANLTFIFEVANLFNHRNVTLVNPLTGRGYEEGDPIPTGDNFFETPPEGYDLPIWADPARFEHPTHWQIGLKWEW